MLVVTLSVLAIMASPSFSPHIRSSGNPTVTSWFTPMVPQVTISPGATHDGFGDGVKPILLPTMMTAPSASETPYGGVTPVFPATPTP